ncbi:MAG TPA: glycosyltransferase family 4 protein [Terriglobia bacterium]|nr:glycosyltransferase family 4 protein [Terriglobia bacterium]
MKVLLIGHACNPNWGSEPAFTWNWAWHLSQKHEVWVLTHPWGREQIESFLALHPNPNLHFVWVRLPGRLAWDPARHKRVSAWRYILWQKEALRQAQRLQRQIGFHIVHHVSWGTVSEPPPFWRVPVPFVWGPVGGGQVTPPSVRSYLGGAAKAEWLRDYRMRLITFRPALRKAVRKSAMILATNDETAQLLAKAGASRVRLFLDTGISEDFLPDQAPKRVPGRLLSLLWAGRLQPRKCLPLALEALAQCKDISVRLMVAGKGALKEEWKSRSHELGLGSRVEFLGQVDYKQMPALYRSADAFIFTSVRDAFGSQVLEAMASGLPIIALDHQGVRAFVPDTAGIKIPVSDPREIVSRFASAIHFLACSPKARMEMGLASWEFARSQTWRRRAELMSSWYEQIIGERPKRFATDNAAMRHSSDLANLASTDSEVGRHIA